MSEWERSFLAAFCRLAPLFHSGTLLSHFFRDSLGKLAHVSVCARWLVGLRKSFALFFNFFAVFARCLFAKASVFFFFFFFFATLELSALLVALPATSTNFSCFVFFIHRLLRVRHGGHCVNQCGVSCGLFIPQ